MGHIHSDIITRGQRQPWFPWAGEPLLFSSSALRRSSSSLRRRSTSSTRRFSSCSRRRCSRSCCRPHLPLAAAVAQQRREREMRRQQEREQRRREQEEKRRVEEVERRRKEDEDRRRAEDEKRRADREQVGGEYIRRQLEEEQRHLE
ncbi:hypothetical protein CRUP_020333, partial [Coryphaenoides rupestris]